MASGAARATRFAQAAQARPTMPTTARLSRLVVYGLPLAFVVFSWLAAPSFPNFFETEESFVSVLQLRSSAIVNPRASVTMSARPVDWQRTNSGSSYTLLPSAPRLLHYLLLGAGLRDLGWQVLFISLLGTAITVALLWRLFAQPALFVVALAVVFDHAGFLAWTLNPSRIWMFVLFFGLVLTAKLDRRIRFGALAFCLIQLDYRIATFVGTTAITFALLLHRWNGWRLVLYGIAGAALPLAIFCLEVLAFYGWTDLAHEIAVARAWLGTMGAGGNALQLVIQALHGPILLLQTIARDTHSVPVFVLVVGGLISALFALSRDSLTESQRFLTYLMLSAVTGTIVASSTLYTPFVEAFVGGSLPLASFLIAPALGIVALELKTALSTTWKSPRLEHVCTTLVLIPLVLASVFHVRPELDNQLMDALPGNLRTKIENTRNVDTWFTWPEKLTAKTSTRSGTDPEQPEKRP
jgi:hypothetical protein